MNVISLSLILSTMHWVLFSMQIMIIPYLAQDLNLTPVQFTVVQTVFALGQMIGNLWYSNLCRSDLKLALLISYVSSSVTYLFLYMSNGFYIFLLSRVVYFAAQTPLGLQTLISANTKPEDRTKYFGQLGATIGFGFALGSFSSGFLVSWLGQGSTMLLGLLLATSALPLIQFCLNPDQCGHKKEKLDEDEPESQKDQGSSLFKDYLRLLNTGPVLVIFVVRCLSSMSMILFVTIFGMYVIEKFQASPIDTSCLMVYGSLFATVANFLTLPYLSKCLNEIQLLYVGFGHVIVFGLGLLLICKFFHFYLIWPFFSMGIAFVVNVCDTEMTKMVKKSDHSLALSLGWFSESALMVISPTISEFALNRYGFKVFGHVFIFSGLFACTLITVCKTKILSVAGDKKDD